MKTIQSLLNRSDPAVRLLNLIQRKTDSSATNRIIPVGGLAGSLAAFLASMLIEETKRTVLVVTSGPSQAETTLDDLTTILGQEKIGFLPPLHPYSFETTPLASGPRSERIEALLRLRNGTPSDPDHPTQPTILVTQPEALLERSPDREWIERHTHRLTVGDEIDREILMSYLIDAGYRRERLVDDQGQYAVRGGLMDIFPYGCEKPIRMEFDGDEINDLRWFDSATQRSVERVHEVVLLIDNRKDDGSNGDLLRLLPDDSIIFWNDLEEIESRVERFLLRYSKPHQSEPAFKTFDEMMKRAEPFQQVIWYGPLKNSGWRSDPSIESSPWIDFGAKNSDPPATGLENLSDYLAGCLERSQNVWITADNEAEQRRLDDLLADYELDTIFTTNSSISNGFVSPTLDITLLISRELFGRRRFRSRHTRFRRRAVQFDRSFLKRGDFVVHINHGIGVYEGFQTIKVREQPRECLRIRYKNNAVLYVPVERFGLVEKYNGSKSNAPRLSSIDGKDWARAKERTRKAVEDMAEELIRLYAKRKIIAGHSFSADTLWQSEMEASFEFDDTPDQIEASAEIKRDLEAPYPMDRLLCGDVGFGKTEVAVRAAFKVVQDSFQVAVLVPTTILAQQHYETFRDRLGTYPVIIEMLSRFRPPAERKRITQRLNRGEVDIVIGTHRLLSRDVEFKRLGLLIIDEEHRFGVKHKEKLKQLTEDVDVLTMTATPIPRTLNLALIEARDTSRINTPPMDRLPIQTEIHPWSEDLIRDAILREVDRNGQVFFLHNRVESIYNIKGLLERWLPDLRYVVGHGQMPERQLEKVMIDFMNHRYDVLVTTTIIESGIDIPNVNTLIINRADRFGLAQLYQIRGRIGRSNRQAYAYLLAPPKLVMSSTARQRLSTLTELTELGSGLKVAMRDLEIRGAGNLLGQQQSGYINAVGFELYTRMLEEMIRKIRNEQEESSSKPDVGVPADEEEIKIDFDGPALLPDNYIDDGDLRYNFYRRISLAKNVDEIDELEMEMEDRFGHLPQSSKNLLEVMRLKLLGRLVGCERIFVEKKSLIVMFRLPSDTDESHNLIRRLVLQADPEPIEFRTGRKLELIYRLTAKDRLSRARRFLLHLKRDTGMQARRDSP